MIIGDTFKLFGHEMAVQLKKESLDLVRYDTICTCCSYPRNVYLEITEKDLEKAMLLEQRMEGLDK